MLHEFSRTALLLGADGLSRLQSAHVAVFGVGGVGGAAAEALARAGVGSLTLIDNDTVSVTNRNRQIIALASTAVFGVGGVGGAAAEALARAGVGSLTLIDNDTVSVTNRNRQIIALASTTGQSKTAVMAARVRDINPACQVTPLDLFYTPESALDLTRFTYVLDAIDTVSAKLYLAEQCDRLGVPLIASMGTGNKLDPTRFEVADIFQTSVEVMAQRLRPFPSGSSG